MIFQAGLESGIPLGKSHHVIDVANIIKTFFRDLPEALLPCGNVQEALIRCLIGGGNDDKVHKLMMTCLLLPPLTLNTLAYFMQFLHTVSMHADKNKMTTENLALILTPSIMPITESIQQRFNSHVRVLQLLIEHSQQIGLIPEAILCKKTSKRKETIRKNVTKFRPLWPDGLSLSLFLSLVVRIRFHLLVSPRTEPVVVVGRNLVNVGAVGTARSVLERKPKISTVDEVAGRPCLLQVADCSWCTGNGRKAKQIINFTLVHVFSRLGFG